MGKKSQEVEFTLGIDDDELEQLLNNTRSDKSADSASKSKIDKYLEKTLDTSLRKAISEHGGYWTLFVKIKAAKNSNHSKYFNKNLKDLAVLVAKETILQGVLCKSLGLDSQLPNGATDPMVEVALSKISAAIENKDPRASEYILSLAQDHPNSDLSKEIERVKDNGPQRDMHARTIKCFGSFAERALQSTPVNLTGFRWVDSLIENTVGKKALRKEIATFDSLTSDPKSKAQEDKELSKFIIDFKKSVVNEKNIGNINISTRTLELVFNRLMPKILNEMNLDIDQYNRCATTVKKLIGPPLHAGDRTISKADMEILLVGVEHYVNHKKGKGYLQYLNLDAVLMMPFNYRDANREQQSIQFMVKDEDTGTLRFNRDDFDQLDEAQLKRITTVFIGEQLRPDVLQDRLSQLSIDDLAGIINTDALSATKSKALNTFDRGTEVLGIIKDSLPVAPSEALTGRPFIGKRH